MSTYGFILGLVITMASLVATLAAIRAAQNIVVAKHSGVDPRADQELARDVHRAMKKQGRK